MTSMSLEWVLGLALMAGLSIPAGALVSSNVLLNNICRRMELDSFVSYFGGGALLAAIALVLIPRSIGNGSVLSVVISFGAGALLFWQFSAWTKRTQNTASQFMAMLLDFFPEAMLLGALAKNDSNMVYLLAGLIALQNMPEGFAAYNELTKSKQTRSRLLIIFLTVPLVGPLAAWLGFEWFSSSEYNPAMILLFFSGGILYLIFEDIAPSAHREHKSFLSLGAICGFLLGLVGTMLIH
ncbi:MAG: divalent cation transporter [Bdellovibrio sp. CG12_big_fil_rev_8_21_14_0_65_39_13]|nr:MAG: divalent cation transporter [Bdellovibrio sp. CG22_combo_CG10-13_8_21_14_all_39_27]PIQ59952.1 MAG: divalent cation transporter [Bdellovibrio sp. CG12_big_fil_rev_8_21_14_0_65_39_13]PIR34585.1 MAG: divalent cation transporter [Bdellovibrio sp. CG11_big_fil_rev_8_21_14_0_20_39_38]